MITFLLLLGAMSVYGQGGHNHGHEHSCIHNNHQQRTASQVVASVIDDMEKDGDGTLSPTEVTDEFVTNYDKDDNGEVSEDEFVHQWHHRYHDVRPFAGYLFHHFDMNDDLKLTDKDVVAMQVFLDADGDGKVSIAEFQASMMSLYKNCVSSHGH
ncbi:uncharacterized protein [Haliotis asinina]|uniref:uncharacterized protein n=1 Tax=Haliotis asinina TaxID=109174 RepID=UPI003532075B